MARDKDKVSRVYNADDGRPLEVQKRDRKMKRDRSNDDKVFVPGGTGNATKPVVSKNEKAVLVQSEDGGEDVYVEGTLYVDTHRGRAEQGLQIVPGKDDPVPDNAFLHTSDYRVRKDINDLNEKGNVKLDKKIGNAKVVGDGGGDVDGEADVTIKGVNYVDGQPVTDVSQLRLLNKNADAVVVENEEDEGTDVYVHGDLYVDGRHGRIPREPVVSKNEYVDVVPPVVTVGGFAVPADTTEIISRPGGLQDARPEELNDVQRWNKEVIEEKENLSDEDRKLRAKMDPNYDVASVDHKVGSYAVENQKNVERFLNEDAQRSIHENTAVVQEGEKEAVKGLYTGTNVFSYAPKPTTEVANQEKYPELVATARAKDEAVKEVEREISDTPPDEVETLDIAKRQAAAQLQAVQDAKGVTSLDEVTGDEKWAWTTDTTGYTGGTGGEVATELGAVSGRKRNISEHTDPASLATIRTMNPVDAKEQGIEDPITESLADEPEEKEDTSSRKRSSKKTTRSRRKR